MSQLANSLSVFFVHSGWFHLIGNMYFLYVFGDNVEDALGKTKYLAFYVLGGAAGAFGQYWVGPDSVVPMIGASGAIPAVLGGYLVLYPRAPVTLINPVILLWLIMGPLIVLPAWAVVGWWFIGNLFGGLASLGGAESQTAFFAHLGGFVGGLLITRPLANKRE